MLELCEEMDDDDIGDSILKEQFDLAVSKLKGEKASSSDGIPAELIKAAYIYMEDLRNWSYLIRLQVMSAYP